MSNLTKRQRLLVNRVNERINAELGQSGGGCHLSSHGSFGNVVGQLACMIEQGVEAIITGIDTAYSVITLPADLAWDLEKPNEPMPQNTPVRRAIDYT